MNSKWLHLSITVILQSTLLLFFLTEVTKAENNSLPKKKISIWELIELDIKPNNEKWMLEASIFSIGDPVHETLTRLGLKRTTLNYRNMEFIRGVFWNDDPCAQLFKNSVENPLKPSFGLTWYYDFNEAEGLSKNNNFNFNDLGCPTLGRSHFGDLQFLHAMAGKDGVKAEVTFKKMMMWAELVYLISIGNLDYMEKVKNYEHLLATTEVLRELASLSASEIFNANSAQATRQRAIGSLIHMIQDSYAQGHVLRDPKVYGSIKQFYSYAQQDHTHHKGDDAWGSGETNDEKISNSPGALPALEATTKILNLYKVKAPWNDVKQYLEKDPFHLLKKTINSGPGIYKK